MKINELTTVDQRADLIKHCGGRVLILLGKLMNNLSIDYSVDTNFDQAEKDVNRKNQSLNSSFFLLTSASWAVSAAFYSGQALSLSGLLAFACAGTISAGLYRLERRQKIKFAQKLLIVSRHIMALYLSNSSTLSNTHCQDVVVLTSTLMRDLCGDRGQANFHNELKSHVKILLTRGVKND